MKLTEQDLFDLLYCKCELLLKYRDQTGYHSNAYRKDILRTMERCIDRLNAVNERDKRKTVYLQSVIDREEI